VIRKASIKDRKELLLPRPSDYNKKLENTLKLIAKDERTAFKLLARTVLNTIKPGADASEVDHVATAMQTVYLQGRVDGMREGMILNE